MWQVSLAQRVAGEEAFKAGKTGVNALVAFLHSDQRALSSIVASAGVAKVCPRPACRAAVPQGARSAGVRLHTGYMHGA